MKCAIVAGVAGLVVGSAAQAGIANVDTFEFAITVEQEVPAPELTQFVEPAGTGFMELDLDTLELTWEITYAGLSGPIVAPGIHLHGPADFGETAGVQIFLEENDNLPPTNDGVITGSAFLTPDQAADLRAGLWYVNIHTELNQPGEIRGQAIPAPGALAALGVAGLAGLRRRR
jgi:hypothetical protein